MDNPEDRGQNIEALINQEVEKLQQSDMVPVRSIYYSKYLEVRGSIVVNHILTKGSMHRELSNLMQGSRFYSVNSVTNKPDNDVDQRKMVENYAKLWLRCNNEPHKIHYDLKGYLKDINIWIVAYHKISLNKGISTIGVDRYDVIDGMSLDKIKHIQKQVITNKYNWKPSKRVYIPKTNGDFRPLGIPSFSDKLVEMVLYLILEPIYEYSFHNRSFGFRPEKSAHSALKYIATYGSGAKWAIKGDISKCFDSVNHKILMNIIKERIKDKLILNLIQSNLKSPIYDKGKLLDENLIGTRQGGILSPLLCNIYLDKLDKEVQNWIDLNTNTILKPNKAYYKFRKRILSGELPRKTLNPYPQKDKSRTNYLKLQYIRYADDFLLLCDTNYKTAVDFKHKLVTFIKERLNLETNLDNTLITKTTKGYKFLGYNFLRRKVRAVIKKNKVVYFRYNLSVSVNIPRITQALYKKGFCNKNGFPISQTGYTYRTQKETLYIMRSILNGYYEWFNLGKNRQKAIEYVYYILRFSAAKTFAAKFHLSSIAKVFKAAGSYLNKPLKRGNRGPLGIVEGQGKYGLYCPKYPAFTLKVQGYRKTDDVTIYKKVINTQNLDLIINWILNENIHNREKTLKDPLSKTGNHLKKGVILLKGPCIVCGTYDNIHIHHVKSIKNIKAKDPIQKHVIALKIKQVPLCAKHHLEYGHGGNWRNPGRIVKISKPS